MANAPLSTSLLAWLNQSSSVAVWEAETNDPKENRQSNSVKVYFERIVGEVEDDQFLKRRERRYTFKLIAMK